MANDYRSLPDGPVLCEACTQAGQKVEMLPHPVLPPEAEKHAESENTELQSYRCPECETLEIFRVD
ncbi:hypothetical protein [Dyella humicola]|uniref:hypothetical protein n=1 Tax=Dyella humicola TaxID=2992126 RepID=UPI00225B66C9|nr:hypothetical protein [Dyella humicola]